MRIANRKPPYWAASLLANLSLTETIYELLAGLRVSSSQLGIFDRLWAAFTLLTTARTTQRVAVYPNKSTIRFDSRMPPILAVDAAKSVSPSRDMCIGLIDIASPSLAICAS